MIGHLTEHNTSPQYTNSGVSKCTTKIICESTEKQFKCCKHNYCIVQKKVISILICNYATAGELHFDLENDLQCYFKVNFLFSDCNLLF